MNFEQSSKDLAESAAEKEIRVRVLARHFVLYLEETGVISNELITRMSKDVLYKSAQEALFLEDLKGIAWKGVFQNELYKDIELEEFVKEVVNQLSMEGFELEGDTSN